jgi:hypothetical protein
VGTAGIFFTVKTTPDVVGGGIVEAARKSIETTLVQFRIALTGATFGCSNLSENCSEFTETQL